MSDSQDEGTATSTLTPSPDVYNTSYLSDEF